MAEGFGTLSMPTLVQRVSLDTSGVSKGVAEINAQTGTFAKLRGELTKLVATPAGQIGLATAAVVGLAAVGSTFQKVRFQIQRETGATGRSLDGLFNTVKAVAKDVPTSFSNITTAVDELHRRGIPLGSTLTELAKQETFLAKITGSDLATTVESTTAVLQKFSVPLRDQPKLLDQIFKASQQAGVGISEIIGPVRTAGAALGQFGFSLTESIALVASLQKGGVNISQALASLRLAFATVTKAGGDPRRALDALVKEFSDGTPKAKAMADAIALFGRRGGVELATAIQKGRFNLKAMLDLITNGRGGIIATGEATLTLGDRFALLKNRALDALQPLGTAVLKVLTGMAQQAGPVFGQLLGAIVHFVSAAAPALAPFGVILKAAFEAALPIISVLAQGLDSVAGALDHLPAPVIAAGAVLGLLTVAALGAADGLIAAAVSGDAFGAAMDVALGPVGLLLGGLALIGVATGHFGEHIQTASQEAKDMKQSLFDLSGAADVFAAGITSADQGLQHFLATQIKSGKGAGLGGILEATGHTVGTLTKHLDDGDAAWKRYVDTVGRQAVSAFATSAKGFNVQRLVLPVVTTELNKQRAAWQQTAQQILVAHLANGDITASTLNLIKAQNKNSDGTLRYGAIVDAVAKKIGTQTVAQDTAAASAANASPTYAALASQFASGAISADDLAKVLTNQFKFSTEGAKAAVKQLGDQVKQLGSAVDAAFPSVSAAAKGLKTDVAGVQVDLVRRQRKFAAEYAQATAEGGKASGKLASDLHDNYAHIREDMRILAADPDPQKFTKNLQQQATDIVTFFTGLQTLVSEGNGALAKVLLDLGVKDGSSLVAGFAADPVKAAAGNKAAELLNHVKAAAKGATLANLPAFVGIGALAGHATVNGAAKGVHQDVAWRNAMVFLNAAAKAGFHPDLKQNANVAVAEAANAIRKQTAFQNAMTYLAGLAHAVKFNLKAPMKTGLLDAHGAVVGDVKVGGALKIKGPLDAAHYKPPIDKAALAASRKAATAISNETGLPNALKSYGVRGGTDFGQGIADGIVTKNGVIFIAGQRAGAAAMAGVTAKIKRGSPSKVAFGYGQDFSTGLALGIVSLSGLVERAGASAADPLLAVAHTVTQAASKTGGGFVASLLGSVDASTLAADTAQLQQLAAAAQALQSALSSTGSSSGGDLASIVQTITGQLPTASTVIQGWAQRQHDASQLVVHDIAAVGREQDKIVKIETKAAAAYAATVHAQAVAAAASARLAADTAAHASKVTLSADTKALSHANTQVASTGRTARSSLIQLGAAHKDLHKLQTQRERDENALKVASNPRAFIAGIVASNASVVRFQGSLARIAKIAPNLAAELAKEGPAVAGRLAAAFAKSPKDAKDAERALTAQVRINKKFTDSITSSLGALAPAASGAGNDVAAGLIKGMEDFIRRSGGKIDASVVEPIKQIINALFGISSPSRWAHGVGGHIIDGLALGLDDRKVRAVAASDQLVRAMRDRLGQIRAVTVRPTIAPIRIPTIPPVRTHVTVTPIVSPVRLAALKRATLALHVTPAVAPLPPIHVTPKIAPLAPVHAPVTVTPKVLPPAPVKVAPKLVPLAPLHAPVRVTPKVDPLRLPPVPPIVVRTKLVPLAPVHITPTVAPLHVPKVPAIHATATVTPKIAKPALPKFAPPVAPTTHATVKADTLRENVVFLDAARAAKQLANAKQEPHRIHEPTPVQHIDHSDNRIVIEGPHTLTQAALEREKRRQEALKRLRRGGIDS